MSKRRGGQAGFAPLIIILITALLGAGFYAGATSNKSLVANIAELVKSPSPMGNSLATTSAQPEQTAKIGTISKDGYTSSQDKDTVALAGRFTIPDRNKIWYELSFPKKSGELGGSLSGACNGKISGSIDSPDSDQESNYRGVLEAKCTPMVGMLYRTEMKAKLEGHVEYKTGRIQIIYDFSDPLPLRGSTDLYFNP